MSRTHKALKDIQGNITKVQSSVACEGAALAAAAEAAALEQQLEQQVLDVLVGLRQRQQQLEVELQDAQAEEQQLKVGVVCCFWCCGVQEQLTAVCLHIWSYACSKRPVFCLFEGLNTDRDTPG